MGMQRNQGTNPLEGNKEEGAEKNTKTDIEERADKEGFDADIMEAKEKEERGEEAPQPNAVGRIFDKLPITFKQADIIAKVALAVAAVVALIAILTAPGSQ